MYSVLWDKQSLTDLKTIDKSEAVKIVKKVESYLKQDPLNLGKTLSGKFKGLFRYRFGNYRIIYEVINKQLNIIVVRVGHRSEIYNV